jgi:D-3-phosphoglycerate dehydrogenase / 2-oxoglutarate reductase
MPVMGRRVLADVGLPLDTAREALAETGVAVDATPRPWSGDDVVGALTWEPLGAFELERLPALRVIATPSVGFDHIDVDEATRRGIWVCNVPDYCVDEMADSALALLLALVRGVVELDRSVRAGGWDEHAAGRLPRLGEIRLGVIGFGRIGRAVAARAQALSIEVWATDPAVSEETIAAAGARAASLDELLRACNAISLHAPLTAETDGLLGERELGLLAPGSYVVNVSRARLVDQEALLAALATGQLAGAAIDTLPTEPPSHAAQAPQAPRLIVTPHAAWYSVHAERQVYRRAAEAVRDALEGSRPAAAVNEV